MSFLHEVIGGAVHAVPGIQAEASRIGTGHVFVLDARTQDPSQGVPPEDIFGYAQVENGKVVPGSYCSNPNHRIVTAAGLFRLPADLQSALLNAMRRLPSPLFPSS